MLNYKLKKSKIYVLAKCKNIIIKEVWSDEHCYSIELILFLANSERFVHDFISHFTYWYSLVISNTLWPWCCNFCNQWINQKIIILSFRKSAYFSEKKSIRHWSLLIQNINSMSLSLFDMTRYWYWTTSVSKIQIKHCSFF